MTQKGYKQLLASVVLVAGLTGHGIAYGQANETQSENANPGTTAWQLTSPAANREIEGYASLTSVNRGGSIDFFVSTSDANYTLEIYRTGWYGGAGGRLLVPAVTLSGRLQPTPSPDPTTNLVECNWTSQYTLTVPNTWVSGVYLVKLVGLTSGKQNYIVFVVREDSRNSAILFKTAVTTYQAYNNWPGPNTGHSLYTFNSAGSIAAYKVSFNRPYYQDPSAAFLPDVGSGYYLRWEYNMVRWMEMSGYDVTYDTDIDVHENSNVLLSHRAVLSVGHDEYWTWQMRSAIVAARDAGVGVGFLSANVCYWQIRLEASTINGAAVRNIVGYKEHSNLDPAGSSSCFITSQWRQNPCVPSEQSFIGVEYIYEPVNADMVIVNPSHWSLAGTGLSNGSHLPGLLGYEVDGNVANNSPPGTTVIASSPIPNTNNLLSQMVSYTAASGATVFATGTIQWSWGMDDWGVPSQRSSALNSAAQQITRNVLARLTGGSVVQPQPPASDEFNSATLNTGLWTFLNPAGGTFSLNGSQLLLSVPGGTTHDPHDPNASGADNAVRVMQSAANVDFDVTVKFDTIPTAAYTNEGIIVEESPTNFLRFEVYGAGSSTYLYASKIIGGSETLLLNSPIAAGSGSLWLEVKRSGNTWTETWSTDGSHFTTGTTFTQVIAMSRIGPFASNYFSPASSTPAFTAAIDYFRNGSSGTTAPNLSIVKTHSGNFSQGGTGVYTITVANSGNAPTSGTATVTDTVPTGLTATAFSGTGWSCSLTPTVSCSRGDALAAGTSYPAMTLTVSVSATAPASVTNTATVSGGGSVTNTANDPTTITGGSTGGAPVADEFNSATLNTGLWTFLNPAGGTFSLNGSQLLLSVPGGTTHDPHDPNASGADNAVRIMQSAANVDFDVTVKFDTIPTAAYTNEGIIVEESPTNFLRFEVYGAGSSTYLYASKIIGGGETLLLNSPIAAGSGSLWLEVKRSGNTWTENWSTDGSHFTTGTTFTQVIAMSRIGPFASNYFSPASSTPAFTAAIDYFRNGSSGTTAPNLSIVKTHSGNFSQGGTGVYTITVANSGNAPTSGTATVTDSLPTGLTATAFSGTGWSCSLTPTVSCSRGDALAAGTSYPAMTLTVSVSATAPASVTNTATVSGGGSVTNTANDPTTITGGSTGGAPVSDEFNSTTLNTNLWTFLNPAGGTYSLNGSQLMLSVPAGATHDPTASGSDLAVRVMQPIVNADFNVIVKFDTIPKAAYTNEGIIVEQDPTNFLRFEMYGAGAQTYLFSSTVTNSVNSEHINAPIAAGSGSIWLQVKRVGNVWTLTWSTDGVNYQPGTSFTQQQTVSRVGPFASNYFSPATSTPGFTAAIDYFRSQ